MKKVVTVVLVGFAVTLAVVVGQRLSVDAMAVVVGVVCGVAASIPTSLLVLLATRRREQGVEQRPAAGPGYPPVVIVNPGVSAGPGMGGPYLPPVAGPSAAPRQFRVIGAEDVLVDGEPYP